MIHCLNVFQSSKKVIHRVNEEMSDRDSGTEAVISVDDVVVAVGQGSTDIEIFRQGQSRPVISKVQAALIVKSNLTEGNINVNDGSRNPVLIPEKKKERKTSTEIIGAERGTWKQEITLLKGLNPTDIKEFLPKPPEISLFFNFHQSSIII